MVHDQQRVHRVTGTPLIEMFGDGKRNRIGIYLEIGGEVKIPLELSKRTFMDARVITLKNKRLLEVSTSVTELFRQFYHFAVAVSERMLDDQMEAAEAVRLELGVFTDLLSEKILLSTERQIGLVGELLFLERLIAKPGLQAVEAWLGPIGEPHDFRIDDREFEVKTTVSSKRIHTVHGLEQLIPSSGCSLVLVSILLGPPGAGAGFSLVGKIAQLSAQFAPQPKCLKHFEAALERIGFRPADEDHYNRQYVMRRAIGLVRVDDAFPAINRPMIQRAMGSLATRVESVQYDVNVEGLEAEDGSASFEAAILVSRPT